jgi:hypothetical protein
MTFSIPLEVIFSSENCKNFLIRISPLLISNLSTQILKKMNSLNKIRIRENVMKMIEKMHILKGGKKEWNPGIKRRLVNLYRNYKKRIFQFCLLCSILFLIYE